MDKNLPKKDLLEMDSWGLSFSFVLWTELCNPQIHALKP